MTEFEHVAETRRFQPHTGQWAHEQLRFSTAKEALLSVRRGTLQGEQARYLGRFPDGLFTVGSGLPPFPAAGQF